MEKALELMTNLKNKYYKFIIIKFFRHTDGSLYSIIKDLNTNTFHRRKVFKNRDGYCYIQFYDCRFYIHIDFEF